MLKRMIVPLLIGLIGIAILVSLGRWQVQRMGWKQGILAQIEADIAADPVPLPAMISIDMKHLPVQATGTIGAEELHVLVSRKSDGAGYRVIAPFTLDDGRRVLLDRGFIPLDEKDTARPAQTGVTIVGNLHWPDDMNSSTPQPDFDRNIWFGRDIGAMATTLSTSDVLIVARQDTGQAIEAMPLGVEGIPNDHLHYAITWFSLALVWLGMTLFLLWRIKTRTV
ncbi:surfeit locus 1 family protein [Pacificibacter maritimus]|uniref:SURF1-like protein n=1 Tax=Pacificibacter maritimus TaxID=762213 RepID=A0A3N4UZN3_9RHOB|nr:SURF1 family protein [Pacificibacter maritimus]RPE67050.1 surfeit locus 1 family protein [Pacificibacter maritimus]